MLIKQNYSYNDLERNMHMIVRKLILFVCIVVASFVYVRTRLWGTRDFKRSVLSIPRQQQHQEKSIDESIRPSMVSNFNQKAEQYVIAYNLTSRRLASSKKLSLIHI